MAKRWISWRNAETWQTMKQAEKCSVRRRTGKRAEANKGIYCDRREEKYWK